ncbi:hypothetical protein KKD70_00985 [Patescibacteria group bacterium]|nr:hypothetical protein [Patescibacteria group bacterium]
MKLRNQFEFLFVGKEEGSFLENYAYDLGEGEESAGQLFVTVEIQNNPADAEMIAETIFDSARKIFFSDLERDPYLRFEDSLKEVNTAIQSFKAETVSNFIGNLHVVLAVTVGDELHISQTGDAEAYLIRKRYCSVISEGLSDRTKENEETFSNIASGTLEPGDFVVVGTTRLLRYISKSDFIGILKSQDLITSLEDLKDALAPEILSKIGIIGMVFHEGLSELSPNEQIGVREYLEDEKPELVRKERINPGKFSLMLRDFSKKMTASINNLLKSVTSGRMTKDKILALLMVMIVLLTGVIWYVKNTGATKREIERLDAVIIEIREEINTASLRGSSNKESAASILSDAEAKAVEVLNSGYHRNKATELLGLIREEKATIDNVVYVSSPRVIADLSTKRENVSALGLIPYKDRTYVYEYNALYEVLLDTISDPVTIDDNETVIAGTYNDDNDALIFITKNGQVINYANDQFQFMDTNDGAFHKGVSVAAYNGNMYLLDSEEKQIWKYAGQRDKYGNAESYITSGAIENPVDLAIDGSIYVLEGDGGVEKFSRGEQVDFSISKLPLDPIESPTRIYTELDLDKIFLLEPIKNRVIVLDKDLQTGNAVYSAQYIFDDSISGPRDMFYEKDSNKLYVLDAQKVYEISL